MAPFSLGATKIADQSWTGPIEGPDALKQFQQYKTRLRHYINDGQDLREPADQKMLWAYMWKHAPDDMAAFTADAPLTLIADELVRLIGPSGQMHAKEGVYYCKKAFPRLCMCIASIANRGYWQVHVVALRDSNYENDFWGYQQISGTSSGVLLDYGPLSQSTVMILRDAQLGTMQYWLVDQCGHHMVKVVARKTEFERNGPRTEDYFFERVNNERAKNFFDKMKW